MAAAAPSAVKTYYEGVGGRLAQYTPRGGKDTTVQILHVSTDYILKSGAFHLLEDVVGVSSNAEAEVD